MATAIYKSYRKRKKKEKAKGKPAFKKEVIMLDDHLFKLDLKGEVKLSTPGGRVSLEFYPARYHEKFRGGWKVGQAWLVKTSKGVFVNVSSPRKLKLEKPSLSSALT